MNDQESVGPVEPHSYAKVDCSCLLLTPTVFGVLPSILILLQYCLLYSFCSILAYNV